MRTFLSTRLRPLFLTIFAAALTAIALSPLLTPHRTRSNSSPAPQDTGAVVSRSVPSAGDSESSSDNPLVGTQTCLRCHAAQHQSYLITAHSKAMSVVVPSEEPPNAEFVHPLSGRHYQVRNDERGLWHTESLSLETDKPNQHGIASHQIVVSEPLKYLVGSGRHSRTYLIERDGFLAESPITWYASTQSWGMSPGYNQRHHAGFERPADESCLICHAGQTRPSEKKVGRADFLELAIGCERCHGPGQAHVTKWSDKNASRRNEGQQDETIVHPGKLSRDRQESICASCHLRGDATVVVSGRSISDFRPGELLSQTRVDYHRASYSGEMTVVGHVTQMHASRCYQKTSTFTCTTCHDSHAESLPENPVAFYRDKCLSCHGETSCGLTPSDRRKQNADDNCVTCHMPQVSTDIPHIAFTHHRVGIHQESSETPSADTQRDVVAFGDISHLPDTDRQRCLGLAYAELSYKTTDQETAEFFRGNAIRRLSDVVANGESDGEVLSTLAQFAWEDRQSAAAVTYAQRALNNVDLSAKGACKCEHVLGETYLQSGNAMAAASHFRKLTQMRRNSEDWFLLGLAEFRNGRRNAAIESLKKAIDIQPFRPELHATLAEFYQRGGDDSSARRHQQLTQLLKTSQLFNR